MPSVFPFRAVQYAAPRPGADGPRESIDLSDLVAPPYDVLDAHGKAALLARNENNAVRIDLPHLPAKELGPPQAYQAAGATFRSWLASGVMHRLPEPAMFVYRETFEFGGATHRRTGMACTIETVPFGPRPGGGILPHEETFSGPKEDRFALMTASKAQFSPIFGLHQDELGAANAILQRVMASRDPSTTARTTDGTLHEVFTVADRATLDAYTNALRGEDIFIADGHHRYTTALNYIKALESGTPVAQDHPARRCLIVLVGMSDPGLVIGPTHRVLGGMAGYSFESFQKAAASRLAIEPTGPDLTHIESAMAARAGSGSVLGLYDFATKRCFTAAPTDPDPLATKFPQKVKAWRQLDVAIVQHLIVEEICQPALNSGNPVEWAFPHSIREVLDIGAGLERGSGGGKSFRPQLGVIVRPTPLESVRAVSRAGELMPQKSTFFYPKLATGLFINPLD